MNIVLVEDYLNKRDINKKKPSKYVAEFEKENDRLDRTLRTHYIGPQRKFGITDDDYETFVKERARRIAGALNKALNPT